MTPYPLIDRHTEDLQAASGRRLSNFALDGELAIEDLTIHADTLRAQAEIAHDAGYQQLAANLNRAAELTVVPNDYILHIYAMLRPQRATYADLQSLAKILEAEYGAHENADFIREAAEIYRVRGLLVPG